MLPLKRGQGVAHSFNCGYGVWHMADMHLADTLVSIYFQPLDAAKTYGSKIAHAVAVCKLLKSNMECLNHKILKMFVQKVNTTYE